MKPTKHAIVDTLVECGAEHAFTLPGLGVTWMLDEFDRVKDNLRVVLARTEQIASIMAQVYGRLTGKPGVFMGQGPWVGTTGAFGVLEAYFAGSPMVVLTDTSCYDGYGMYGVYQTMTGDYGAADIRTTLATMTKYTGYATEPHEAVFGLQMAFKHAQLPRRGPAALVLKSPIIKREFDGEPVENYPSAGFLKYTPAKPDPQAVDQLARAIAAAELPVIIAGGGAQNDRTRELIGTVATRAGIAVATSYNGKGVVDETSEVACGMLGTWGARSANRLLARADLVVVLGASLAPDYMRFRDKKLLDPESQKIIQVDIDPRNAGWVYPVEQSITADVADVLELLDGRDLGEGRLERRLAAIAENNREHGFGEVPDQVKAAAPGTVHLSELVQVIDRSLRPDDMLTLDAGSNRIWATSLLRVATPGQLVVPGGAGGMGWGLPAAAATRLVYPDRNVISLIGDGGAAMTISTLATCVQEDLPITVIVANNQGLGMVRDNMKGRRVATDFSPIDFAAVAEGMGCLGVRVNTPEALEAAIAGARHSGRTTVIDVTVDPAASHVDVSDYEGA